MTTVADILAALDRLAPFRLAEEWDNVGLLVGDAGRPVERVLVCLDTSDGVCDEAERTGADCLLSHHPLFLNPVRRFTGETVAGRLALRLARDGRALIAAHTNLDAADGGLCDLLARRVGLVELEPLQAAPAPKKYKVVVFVPEEALGAVRRAAFEAGAGRIGNYSECSFSCCGTGTFLPGEEARPAVGRKGEQTIAAEHRLELLVEEVCLGAVVAAISRAHPYETPAIDVYPLEGLPEGPGLGRVGWLEKPKALAELADETKRALGLETIRLAGESAEKVERVAVLTGSGSGLVDAVLTSGCQAYLTGELKFHEAQTLAARGIGVILGGHYETERAALEDWAPRLQDAINVEIVLSEGERGVFSAR
ncbi:MAG TPA: Nif3-like dinuclear metal center hexameric protein [Phycisphaerae bacterium]|nr:Nif3-like dinuclear metal center hexameric protein [Phycisphaerae bacterium]